VCRRLLAEQAKLDKVVAEIETPMQFFKALDDIGPRLALPLPSSLNPNPAVATATVQRRIHPDDEQFKLDLARLDECIDFLESRPHFAEQAVYLEKFRQLQAKAFDLIRAWVVESIAKATDSVYATNKDKRTVLLLDDPHLYHRYSELGKRLRPVIEELERRPGLGAAPLRDCLVAYCASRQRLLARAVEESDELKPDANLVFSIIRGSSFLTGVCRAEHKLVSCFFSLRGYRQLDDGDVYSETMSRIFAPLYTTLRVAIVRAVDLEVLCDALSAVEAAVTDLARLADPEASDALADVLALIASDAQERLVFCAVRVLRDDVQGFTPVPEDLAYPERLKSENAWYPTLERTLSCLSKVFRVIEPIVFEQLAQEAVAACTATLLDAAKRIAKRATLDDAELFLIKHLLLLREQISPFHAALSSKDFRLDFASTSAAFANFFARPNRSRMLQLDRSNALIDLVRQGIPTVSENEVNTKRDLDLELKKASEAYVDRVTRAALGPLREFVDAAQAFLQVETATWDTLVAQDFCSKARVTAAVAFCQSSTLAVLEKARGEATLYLVNPQTRAVLFNAIEANVFKTVNAAGNLARDLFKDDDALNEKLRELLRSIGALRTSPAPSLKDVASPVVAAVGESRV